MKSKLIRIPMTVDGGYARTSNRISGMPLWICMRELRRLWRIGRRREFDLVISRTPRDGDWIEFRFNVFGELIVADAPEGDAYHNFRIVVLDCVRVWRRHYKLTKSFWVSLQIEEWQ